MDDDSRGDRLAGDGGDRAPDIGGARLRATMDAMLDPHVVLASVRDESGAILDFRFVDANAAACAYIRLSRRDLVGVRLLERGPAVPESGLFEACCRVVETGEPLVLDGVTYESHAQAGRRLHYDVRGVRVGDGVSLTWRDVTDRHRASESLRAQRDLAVALGAAADIGDALQLVMEAALGLDGVDAAGIYLLDPESGDLRLAVHTGLSGGFVDEVRHLRATDKRAQLVKENASLFASRMDLLREPGTRRETEEGLRAFAALPIRSDGVVVAVVNLASRTMDEFTRQQSSLMETLAAQVGGAVGRLRREADLREELARLRARETAATVSPGAGRA